MPDAYYWDANVFLSYLDGKPADRMPILEDFLRRSRQRECRIVTSTWSLTEVAYDASEGGTRILDSAVEQKIDAMWADRATITLVEVHERLQREARRLMREGIPRGWNLKPADAIHLATAVSIGAAEFHTYDRKLEKFTALVGFPVQVPTLKQGILPFQPPADMLQRE